MTDIEKGSISYSVDDNIGTIEFHHPKGNSLPGALLRELAETIENAGKNDGNNVIVIRSKGEGAFCAGASFDELLAIDNFVDGKKFFMGFAHVLNAMRTCPKLIVVRVQGKTVGGGIGIASAADYCIAHRNASIKLSELALGIGPFVVGPAVSRKLGTAAFSSLALDARNWYTSDWAHSKGLFNKVVDTTEELDEAVQQLASDLASSNPEAMKEMKEILWQSTGHWNSTLEQRAEISGRLVLSEFTRNFIREFKKK
ncbi:enoyl-CoA hydratase/isomerase family protein [Rhodohalobacter halophilus]|uniref:enoyl-CoA hydratase/isomerase family protein n=1 Tax=Rhodohalobacter halophilus TaxID=1812810 RepID=UPI00083F9F5A|nr:enoyl-CoA hydratase/isomerase family protein [Rhodohalobacter halophilus]